MERLTSRETRDNGGSLILHVAVAAAVFVTCCWPYFIWHGEDQYGRMQWDASSWAACVIWWISASVVIVLVRVNSPAVRAAKAADKRSRELEKLRRKSSAPWKMYRDPQPSHPRNGDLRAHALREERWL